MKHIVLAMGLMIALTVQAQLVQENEMALVYYMPQTQVRVEVTYEQVERHAGQFAKYAKHYLAATDIVTTDTLFYRVVDACIQTRTITDYSRAFKVVAEKGIETQLLSLTPQGVLLGYNIAPEEKEHPTNMPKHDDKKHELPEPMLRVMPLLEEQLVGKSVAEMAAGAAKQIFRIRETRLYILGGEVDHAPADGTAMKRVLAELDKQEKELTELFIGTETVTKHKKSFDYTPVKTEEVAIAHFNAAQGWGKEGMPLTLSIQARRQMKSANTSVQGKNDPTPSQLYYNIPGSAEIQVLFGQERLAERSISVAQFGVAVPLARELFMKELPHIYFNTKTGNIQSIYK